MTKAMDIETGDIVHHAPTGEKWLVAYVDGDRLCAVGWPETIAKLSDCTLVIKAEEDVREQLIKELAAMPGHEYDSRRSWARHYLSKVQAQ